MVIQKEVLEGHHINKKNGTLKQCEMADKIKLA
jgi:hypothetical protein